MRKTILFITALLAMTSAANASGLPRYDPESYCRSVADISGGSASIFAGCIDMEQEAYNELKIAWASISQRTRNYCDEVARVSGDGSYSLLSGCIDMESDAAASTPKFKF